jgi:hypothetical protein
MRSLVDLYPGRWRERYGDELQYLLDERPPSILDRFDVIRGAVDAHLHPQLTRPEVAPDTSSRAADLRVARRLGAGAIIGSLVWTAALLLAVNGPIRYDTAGSYRDGAAASPFIFLSVALLVAGLYGQLIWLPGAARLARIGAGTAIPVLLLWSIGPWLWFLPLIALAGLAALAIGGRRAGAWPTAAVIAVGGSVVVAVGSIGLAIAIGSNDRMVTGPFFWAAFTGLLPSWLAVGATLVRRAV